MHPKFMREVLISYTIITCSHIERSDKDIAGLAWLFSVLRSTLLIKNVKITNCCHVKKKYQETAQYV